MNNEIDRGETFADPVDRAVLEQQRLLERQLEAAKKAASAPRLVSTGHCHNCSERLGDSRLFCDADCRDDFQLRQARRKVNGG